MQEGLWHETGRRCFSSVQDFWDAEDLEGQAASVWKGKLQKGLADDGKLREFRREDMERGLGPDTLIVLLLLNHDRKWNRERLQPPPPRTGLFSAFMDEVEEVATQAGCQCVRVADTLDEFVPEKLEERGYERVPCSDDPNPDYVKVLPRG